MTNEYIYGYESGYEEASVIQKEAVEKEAIDLKDILRAVAPVPTMMADTALGDLRPYMPKKYEPSSFHDKILKEDRTYISNEEEQKKNNILENLPATTTAGAGVGAGLGYLAGGKGNKTLSTAIGAGTGALAGTAIPYLIDRLYKLKNEGAFNLRLPSQAMSPLRR